MQGVSGCVQDCFFFRLSQDELEALLIQGMLSRHVHLHTCSFLKLSSAPRCDSITHKGVAPASTSRAPLSVTELPHFGAVQRQVCCSKAPRQQSGWSQLVREWFDWPVGWEETERKLQPPCRLIMQ